MGDVGSPVAASGGPSTGPAGIAPWWNALLIVMAAAGALSLVLAKMADA